MPIGNPMSGSAVRIEGLTAEERLALLERLWDSLSNNPANVPVSDRQKAELDRRLDALAEDLDQGANVGVPWDEVVRQIRSRG